MSEEKPVAQNPSPDVVDSICDEYERALAENRELSIEDLLKRCPDEYRSELFRELLAIDLERRSESEETILIDSYLSRFPEHAETIRGIANGIQSARLPYVPSRPVNDFLSGTQGDSPADTGPASDTSPLGSLASGSSFGEYEIIRRIGQGGMGVVYQARHRSLDRIVALKMLRANVSGKHKDRFLVEARLASSLDHPAIVPVFDHGEINGNAFYTMAFISGQPLDEVVKSNPLPQQQAAQICKSLADGVEYAHQQNVLHRDLKPQNVLMDGDQPRIADFGLARIVEGESDLTQEGQVLGTPNYMPPEQAGRHHRAGRHSDVYSLGAILYRIVSGRPPFQAANPIETLRQVLREEAPPLRQLNRALDVDLETICMKCLGKEPEQRYATAAELSDELQRYLEGRPIQARPIGRLGRLWKWCRRHPGIATLSLSLILVTLVGMAMVTWKWQEAVAANLLAEENLRRAVSSVERYYVIMSKWDSREAPGTESMRKDLLAEAIKYYQEFVASNGNRPDLILKVAEAEERVAEIHNRMGKEVESFSLYEKAIQRYKAAIKLKPESREARVGLAKCLADFAQDLRNGNQAKRAVAQLDQALALWGEIETKFGATVEQEDHVAGVYGQLSSCYFSLNEYQKSSEMRAKQDALMAKLLKDNPKGNKLRYNRCVALFNEAVHLRNTGEFDKAFKKLREANDLWLELHSDIKEPPPAAEHLHLQILEVLVLLHRERREHELSNDLLTHVIERRYALADSNPDVADYSVALLYVLTSKASQCLAEGDTEGTGVHFTLGMDVIEKLSEKGVNQHDIHRHRAELWHIKGDMHLKLNDGKQAVDAMQQALNEYRVLGEDSNANASDRNGLGNRYRWLAEAYRANKDRELALETFAKAREIFYREFDSPESAILEPRIWYVASTRERAEILHEADRQQEADDECQIAVDLARKFESKKRTTWKHYLHLNWALLELAKIQRDRKLTQLAVPTLVEAAEAHRKMADEIPEMAIGTWEEYSLLCECHLDLNQLEQAQQIYQQQLTLFTKHRQQFPNDTDFLNKEESAWKSRFSQLHE